jgi:biotin carboxyl carrier protein
MNEGESVDAAARVIVSPAAGVYVPVDDVDEVTEGGVIGHIEVAGELPVPVRSAFDGRVIEVLVWPGERVRFRQRIAWLRVG